MPLAAGTQLVTASRGLCRSPPCTLLPARSSATAPSMEFADEDAVVALFRKHAACDCPDCACWVRALPASSEAMCLACMPVCSRSLDSPACVGGLMIACCTSGVLSLCVVCACLMGLLGVVVNVAYAPTGQHDAHGHAVALLSITVGVIEAAFCQQQPPKSPFPLVGIEQRRDECVCPSWAVTRRLVPLSPARVSAWIRCW